MAKVLPFRSVTVRRQFPNSRRWCTEVNTGCAKMSQAAQCDLLACIWRCVKQVGRQAAYVEVAQVDCAQHGDDASESSRLARHCGQTCMLTCESASWSLLIGRSSSPESSLRKATATSHRRSATTEGMMQWARGQFPGQNISFETDQVQSGSTTVDGHVRLSDCTQLEKQASQ